MMTEEISSTPIALREALQSNTVASPQAGQRTAADQSSSPRIPRQSAQEAASVGQSLLQIPVTLQVVLGSARLPLARIAELAPGTILNLDQKLGEPATILVNGREIAKGNLFVTEGENERLGITITEIISAGQATP